MKITAVLQACLVARALTQHTASEHFNRICFGLDDRTEQIVPGYTVRYKCDAYGPHDGNRIPVYSPRDCAILCESTRGCKGSSWLSDQNQCVLNGEQPSGIRQKTIYMKKVEVDPFPEGEDPFGIDLEEAIKQCQENKKGCTDNLALCNDQRLQDQQNSAAQLGACEAQNLNDQKQSIDQLGECKRQNIEIQHKHAVQLNTCQEENFRDRQSFTTQLAECRDQNLKSNEQHHRELEVLTGQLKDSQEQRIKEQQEYVAQLSKCQENKDTSDNPDPCLGQDGKEVVIDGTRFQVWCKRLRVDALSVGTKPGASLTECIRACGLRKDCSSVLHKEGYCNLVGYSGFRRNDAAYTHDNAVKV